MGTNYSGELLARIHATEISAAKGKRIVSGSENNIKFDFPHAQNDRTFLVIGNALVSVPSALNAALQLSPTIPLLGVKDQPQIRQHHLFVEFSGLQVHLVKPDASNDVYWNYLGQRPYPLDKEGLMRIDQQPLFLRLGEPTTGYPLRIFQYGDAPRHISLPQPT